MKYKTGDKVLKYVDGKKDCVKKGIISFVKGDIGLVFWYGDSESSIFHESSIQLDIKQIREDKIDNLLK